MDNGFGKNEKLKSKKQIESLFVDAQNAKAFPLMVFYKEVAEGERSKAAFSVSKRKFKKAVDRNRIKRQMREAYRLNKHILNVGSSLIMMFIFISPNPLPYRNIDNAMIQLLKKLKK